MTDTGRSQSEVIHPGCIPGVHAPIDPWDVRIDRTTPVFLHPSTLTGLHTRARSTKTHKRARGYMRAHGIRETP